MQPAGTRHVISCLNAQEAQFARGRKIWKGYRQFDPHVVCNRVRHLQVETVGFADSEAEFPGEAQVHLHSTIQLESEPGQAEIESYVGVGELRFAIEFQVEFDPVAVEDAALWRDAGPCTGSMCGEVGLRPRLSGGSGWQWYARMHTEPVMLPICIHDPVLGQTRKTVFLLPGVNVLDWSHG